jgi:hypothetical protein
VPKRENLLNKLGETKEKCQEGRSPECTRVEHGRAAERENISNHLLERLLAQTAFTRLDHLPSMHSAAEPQ